MGLRQFIVTVDVPKGVTLPEMCDYITEAVGVWKGQLHPDERLFDLDGDSVKVKSIPAKKKKAR